MSGKRGKESADDDICTCSARFYSMIYQIETVKTVIAQPRLSADPSVYTLTAEELRAFGHEVWAKSKLILDGKGNSSRRQQRVGSAGQEPYARQG